MAFCMLGFLELHLNSALELHLNSAVSITMFKL
jgi:hypothetical protein